MWNETIRALMVDDNPDDAELVSLSLAAVNRPQITFEYATSLQSAQELLRNVPFDVVLLDLGLADCTGLATLEQVRTASGGLPIVVLTGLSDEEVALSSLDHGAQDYLIKGNFTPEGLCRALRYAMQRQHLVQALAAANELLEKKNRHLVRLYETAHRFVNNVSHEFRTPLTVIKEYSAMLSEGFFGPLSDEQRHYLTIVGDRADDLNTMVDDMLDVSRLEAGLLRVRRQRESVADIVASVRPSLERKAAVKHVSLEFDIPEFLPEVFCDAEKAGRVVTNLAVNAIKFCRDPGRVRIWARYEPDSEDVILGVTDNGPGIDEASRDVIFRRYQQLNTETSSSTKGFGLGLSIAADMVELNFGSLDLESQVGRGSTFSFTLPLDVPSGVLRRYLERVGTYRDSSPFVSLIRAHIDASADDADADGVQAALSSLVGQNDLVLQSSLSGWLFVLNLPAPDVKEFLESASSTLRDYNRNRIGGLLPGIVWRSLGTWDVFRQREALKAAADLELAVWEEAHA